MLEAGILWGEHTAEVSQGGQVYGWDPWQPARPGMGIHGAGGGCTSPLAHVTSLRLQRSSFFKQPLAQAGFNHPSQAPWTRALRGEPAVFLWHGFCTHGRQVFSAKPRPSATQGPPKTLLAAQNSWEGEKIPPWRMEGKLQVR